MTSEKDPAAIGWGKLGVDVVLESTGVFRSRPASTAANSGSGFITIPAPPPNG